MGNYILVSIVCEPDLSDVLIAELAEINYEGFLETEVGFDAYLPENDFNEESLLNLLDQYQLAKDVYSLMVVKQENWNAQWESSFEPVDVLGKILIKAPFHQIDQNYPYTLIIQPKTSFGTGHHETTHLVLQLMLETDFKEKEVLDYGSGTGILAIFASMLGAKEIFCNDIDEWASENIFENCALNKVTNLTFKKGDLDAVPAHNFQVILANLNRNILMQSFEGLSQRMDQQSKLFISGFYESDLPDLLAQAEEFGLTVHRKLVLNTWCAAELQIK